MQERFAANMASYRRRCRAAAAHASPRLAAARALGGYGSVSPAVKLKVLEAARRLDYRPNELARTMATGRSGTIGVIIGDIENPFFGSAVRGLSDCAAQSGFDVILSNSDETIAAERAAVAVLLAKRVDGLIVAPATMHDKAHLEDAQAQDCPLVLLDREAPGLPVDVAIVDNQAAAREATKLLIQAGHRRIAYVSATAAANVPYESPAQIALTTVRSRITGLFWRHRLRPGCPNRAATYASAQTIPRPRKPSSAIFSARLTGRPRSSPPTARSLWKCSGRPKRWG